MKLVVVEDAWDESDRIGDVFLRKISAGCSLDDGILRKRYDFDEETAIDLSICTVSPKDTMTGRNRSVC